MHQVPHSPIVSVTRRERAFYEQKGSLYLGTFRVGSRVLPLVISIALDEARLWFAARKISIIEPLGARVEERQRISSELLSKWREEPSLVVEQRESRRICRKPP